MFITNFLLLIDFIIQIWGLYFGLKLLAQNIRRCIFCILLLIQNLIASNLFLFKNSINSWLFALFSLWKLMIFIEIIRLLMIFRFTLHIYCLVIKMQLFLRLVYIAVQFVYRGDYHRVLFHSSYIKWCIFLLFYFISLTFLITFVYKEWLLINFWSVHFLIYNLIIFWFR